MNLIAAIEDMIKFRTETGNSAEIEKCLAYMQNLGQKAGAKVQICRYEHASPVFFAANTDASDYDVLILGHIDVVPATDDMFIPRTENGRMYGRGTLDMKSFAVVALNSLIYVLEHKLPLKFGVILSTDEEKGSKSTEAFMDSHQTLSANLGKGKHIRL